jgi:hypothetical protein
MRKQHLLSALTRANGSEDLAEAVLQTAARYYGFDPDFRLELEPEVVHFEAIA